MSREVTISAVQLPNYRTGETDIQKRESNIVTALEMLSQAGERGSDIACLGEVFSTLGINTTKENLLEKIETVPGEVCERVGKIAKKYEMYIIAPVFGLVDGVPRNVAQVIDRNGRYIGGYFKVHPTDGELELGIVAGDDWPIFELDFGKIGIQICHDNSFPESARCLALNGAEIIFWPHVQSGWGDIIWDITLRSRAIDNCVFFVSACYGCEDNRAWRPGMMQGRSGIVDQDGLILAEAGRKKGIATTTVDLEKRRIAHSFTLGGEYDFWTDVLNNRRPDTYGPIVRPKKRVPPKMPEGPRPWLEGSKQ